MTLPPDAGAARAPAPTVLAIDTTAATCSVAIDGAAGRARRAEPMTHGHSRRVLALVDEAMRTLSLDGSRIDAIGFGAGPGAFTGLRIACGIAQGLGFGWGVPLVPVDAMRTLARQAADAAAPGAAIAVALDVRMGEVCHAAFRVDPDADDGLAVLTDAALAAPDSALAAFDALGEPRWLAAGDGFDAYAALADRATGAGWRRVPGATQPDAAAVARLALVGLRAGRAVDAAQAAPLYLRDKVALDVDEQAALRAARAAAR